MKKSYYPALTGIRAIAAYMVFFHHFNPFIKGSILAKLTDEAHIGVTIFFVLSGFLIPTRYLNEVKFSWSWIGRYFQNRVARIYPLYALLTIITFAIYCYAPATYFPGWLTTSLKGKIVIPLLNLTFLRGFFDDLIFTGVAQGWTLTVEECFYFLAPALLYLLNRSKKPYGILLISGLTLAAIGCLLVKVLPHFFGLFATYKFMFYRTFFGRVTEFMLGAALALFVKKYGANRKGIWLTSIGILWLLAGMVVLSLLTESSTLFSIQQPEGIAINNIAMPLGIVVLFYGLLAEYSWLRTFLETKLLDILGKSSYAFYLIHMGVLHVFLTQHKTPIIVQFFVCMAIAYLLWRFVEEPINHWVRSWKKPSARHDNIEAARQVVVHK